MESIDNNWIEKNMKGTKIPVLDAGIVKYNEAFDIQSKLASKIIEKDYKGIILLLEHPPVITIGSNRSRDNLISTERKLRESGIELISTNRGGDITLHAPGQIICYPVLNLKYLKKDLTAFVYNLEQVILDTLEVYGIKGRRVKKHRGVFIGNSKIASIGLKVRKWVSIHGFSLNVDIDLSYFQHIIACGLKDFPQVSMSGLLEKNIAIDDVKEQIIISLESVFGIKTFNTASTV
jgi:lipoate-protein ligase B